MHKAGACASGAFSVVNPSSLQAGGSVPVGLPLNRAVSGCAVCQWFDVLAELKCNDPNFPLASFTVLGSEPQHRTFVGLQCATVLASVPLRERPSRLPSVVAHMRTVMVVSRRGNRWALCARC